jgi:hypothetical protein
VKILWAIVGENSILWQRKAGFGSHEPKVVCSIQTAATIF